jgi:Kdo2-lipid IVA lauroyltransferase/acyltransferase
MEAAGYYIFLVLNRLIMLLPVRVIYMFSDVIFILLYYFPSYRKKVVTKNLSNSFPEKPAKEIRSISRKFYRHLADLFIETLMLDQLSEAKLMKRFTLNNTELLDRLYKEKRNIIAVLGHYNNWEWLSVLPAHTPYKVICIYKPLHNKNFDNLINEFRTKHGVVISPMSSIVRELLEDQKKGINTLAAFISDQTPPKGDIKYWTTFLNQDTPVYLGAEKIASKYDSAVVFFRIDKLKRGYYSLNPELLYEHTKGLPEYAITEAHVKRLEEIIREKPEFWIWSHRRWKHKKPVQDA